jgi:perosamine synthetase
VIPFFKPASLGFWETKELHKSINSILDSGILTDGIFCRRFENQVKRLYHVDHVFVAPNATVALDVLVKIFNPSVVFSPAFTWKSLQGVFTGRRVEWLDIDKSSWLPTYSEGRILGSEALLVYNHTFGNVGSVKRGWHEKIVYDGAQAFGAEIDDFGDATVFGFAPTKPLTTGEGGMIVTNNSNLAENLENRRHAYLRMSEFQAAVGLVYMRKLSENQAKRAEIWNYYNKHLPYPHQEVPFFHSHSVYGVLVEERDKLIDKIKDKMEYRVYYEPLTRGLTNTDHVYSQILCIPSYAGCPYKDIVELLSE